MGHVDPGIKRIPSQVSFREMRPSEITNLGFQLGA